MAPCGPRARGRIEAVRMVHAPEPLVQRPVRAGAHMLHAILMSSASRRIVTGANGAMIRPGHARSVLRRGGASRSPRRSCGFPNARQPMRTGGERAGRPGSPWAAQTPVICSERANVPVTDLSEKESPRRAVTFGSRARRSYGANRRRRDCGSLGLRDSMLE